MAEARVIVGEPVVPGRFVWRDREYGVAAVVDKWKSYGDCTHGSGERYVRKHWFRIRTTDGSEMTLYYERQAKSRRGVKTRWWLYTIEMPSP